MFCLWELIDIVFSIETYCIGLKISYLGTVLCKETAAHISISNIAESLARIDDLRKDPSAEEHRKKDLIQLAKWAISNRKHWFCPLLQPSIRFLARWWGINLCFHPKQSLKKQAKIWLFNNRILNYLKPFSCSLGMRVNGRSSINSDYVRYCTQCYIHCYHQDRVSCFLNCQKSYHDNILPSSFLPFRTPRTGFAAEAVEHNSTE